MARATLGIAMGAVGTDVAIETADIALMSDDLTKLPWLIKHTKKISNLLGTDNVDRSADHSPRRNK